MAGSLRFLLSVFLVLAWVPAVGQTTRTGSIFTCVGPGGKPMTGDRELVGCVGDQTERYRDGSVKRIVPRSQTEDEKAAEEEKKRRLEREATERRIEQRKDESLVRLYPDVAALERARQAALAPTVTAIRISEERNQQLLAARRRLNDELEFYLNRQIPPKLKNDLDASDAALAAQRQAQQMREDEFKRNNDNYDATLARLKILWARQGPAPK